MGTLGRQSGADRSRCHRTVLCRQGWMQMGAGTVGLCVGKDFDSLGDPLGTLWGRGGKSKVANTRCLLPRCNPVTLPAQVARQSSGEHRNLSLYSFLRKFCSCQGEFIPEDSLRGYSQHGSWGRWAAHSGLHQVGEDELWSPGGITKGDGASPASFALAAFPCRARPHQVKAGRHQAAQQSWWE